jgi:hypothetical protein
MLFAQNSATIKSILLEQLKKTHSEKDWFAPVNIAIEGMTAQQAMWKDNSGNHSVAELTSHLIFWNERNLLKFKGQKVSDFTGDNTETFKPVNQQDWEGMVKKLDQVLDDLEKAIEQSSEEKLKEWYSTIANINTHNAYHTGQIIFVRKLQGSWDPEKGVK